MHITAFETLIDDASYLFEAAPFTTSLTILFSVVVAGVMVFGLTQILHNKIWGMERAIQSPYRELQILLSLGAAAFFSAYNLGAMGLPHAVHVVRDADASGDLVVVYEDTSLLGTRTCSARVWQVAPRQHLGQVRVENEGGCEGFAPASNTTLSSLVRSSPEELAPLELTTSGASDCKPEALASGRILAGYDRAPGRDGACIKATDHELWGLEVSWFDPKTGEMFEVWSE